MNSWPVQYRRAIALTPGAIAVIRIATIFADELKKKVWNSWLQLVVAGILLYYVAMVLGSAYACGPGNSDVTRGVFQCSYGDMQPLYKVLIVFGIAAASLCLGRAISLVEKRRLDVE
jgi:hypothetical protein